MRFLRGFWRLVVRVRPSWPLVLVSLLVLVGAAGVEAGHVDVAALWHFDKPEGQIVFDASGHSNHGTLGSSP